MQTFNLALFSLLLAIAGSSVAASQPVTAAERSDAEQYFSGKTSGLTLHSAHQFPDGAKGEIMGSIPSRVVILNNGLTKPKDIRLHRAYCSAISVVTATANDSVSYLTSQKDVVVTRSTFTVLQVYKPNAAIAPGQAISVTYLGGDVVDAGETLRIQNIAQPGIVSGNAYLIVLSKQGGLGGSFYTESSFVPLVNNQLTPAAGDWYGFNTGASLGDFQSRINSLLQTAPCN